jgi:hypothetical protein
MRKSRLMYSDNAKLTKQMSREVQKLLLEDALTERFEKFEPYDRESDPRIMGTSSTPPRDHTLSDFLRMQMHEEGFARKIFPPTQVQPSELRMSPYSGKMQLYPVQPPLVILTEDDVVRTRNVYYAHEGDKGGFMNWERVDYDIGEQAWNHGSSNAPPKDIENLKTYKVIQEAV